MNTIRRPSRWALAVLLVSVLFCASFLVPMMTKSSSLTNWKTTSQGFGIGFPWLGKSLRERDFGCSGGCHLATTQRISFGPFFYEQRLETSMSPSNSGFNETLKNANAAFDELK